MNHRLSNLGWLAVVTTSIVFTPAGCTLFPKRNESNDPSTINGKLVDQQVKFDPPEKEEPTAKMLADFGNIQAAMTHYQQAEELFLRSLSLDAKFEPAYVGLSKVYQLTNRDEMAMQSLEAGLKKLPKSPPIWNEIAVLHSRQGNLPKAMAAAEKALKGDPQNTTYLANYGNMLALAGRIDQSHAVLSRCLAPADARFQIAGILYSQGNKDASRQQLRLALQTDPRHLKSAQALSQIDGNPNIPVNYQTPASSVK